MGCGKSYFAKSLSQQLNYNCVDLDDEIEQYCNASIDQIFNSKGEDYFRKIENQLLLQQIANTSTNTIIATGGGTPCFYNGISIMNNTGITIWLNPSINTIVKNINSQNINRPLLQNTSNNNLENKLEHILQQRQSCYIQSKHQLNDNELAISNLQKIILQYA